MPDNPITVSAFRKDYGKFTAVQGIDFTVQPGEIFGLLGPNGAGKTTTLECLEGIRQPTAGALRVLDIDPVREPARLAQAIGVQLQSSGLPPSMTVDEAIKFFCAYHKVKPRYDLIERMGLNDKRRTVYEQLSVGLKRRLNLIYEKHTGRSYEEIENALERDRFLSPEEAKSFGLIDNVFEKRAAPDAS